MKPVFFKKIALLTMGIFLCTYSAHAQETPLEAISQIEESSLILTQTPKQVQIGDSITFSIKSFSIPLDTFTIAWSINGKQQKIGGGLTSFSFVITERNPRITAEISREGTIYGTKNTTVTTDSLDILYEARNSYAPAFYKGRTLPIRESDISIVALPPTNSQKYTYNWQKDFTNQSSKSGYEKNIFSYKNNVLKKADTITVEGVGDNGKKLQGQLLIDFIEKPSILFYEKKDEGFDYQYAIENSLLLFDKKATIVAEPYFIGAKNILDSSINCMEDIGGGRISMLAEGGTTPYAYFHNGNRSSENISDITNGIHQVYVRDVNGCRDSVEIDLSCCRVFIPNAFSPDGNGTNDYFNVIPIGTFKVIKLDIVNRYGTVIFSSNQANKGWDGTFNDIKADVGTYYYRLLGECEGQEVEYKGDIELLR